ncbi:CBS domain-containing protein [Maribellus comscasis]|uniref:histidine kinase n=1 Tax=Maribellus comscasis TaxID=2681766 RepID=A0A6I6KBK4_9BACT|nr:histidine kinase dimerization/phospho-acceptor domain-containing protein [Maribellus comscasis]QGY47614.1 CBS domain-containing protein [Maribellus comscasis]
MIDLNKYISPLYHSANPFEGINSIEDRLLSNKYLVVIDEQNEFHGILTEEDIIRRPHKIVIDCVSPKENVCKNDTIKSIIEKFDLSRSPVLAVMEDTKFVGVIEKQNVLKELEAEVEKLFSKSLLSKNSKEYFLSNLSHEIRTPLNGILGFIDILKQLEAAECSTDKNDIVELLEKTTENFLILLNDLVELSLIEAGEEIAIKKENVDIAKTLKELKLFFETLPFSQGEKINIDYLNPEPSFCIYTDKNRIKHILYHLLDNAIKFSAGNRVTCGFTFNQDSQDVDFFVRNKWCKDSIDIRKMFDIFEKQERIEKRINFGLGIGLSLVKKLVNLLGGSIKVESYESEIIFRVKIPVK